MSFKSDLTIAQRRGSSFPVFSSTHAAWWTQMKFALHTDRCHHQGIQTQLRALRGLSSKLLM